MIEAGEHKVKEIVDCFFGESKEKKTPYFCINLKTESGVTLPWITYMVKTTDDFRSEDHKNAQKNAIETLVRMGFKSTRKLSDMAELDVADLFEEVTEDIKIVVEIEEYDGKSRPRIKFVNVGNRAEKLTKTQVLAILKSTPYDGWMAQAHNSIRPSVKKKEDKKPVDDDVPF